jgi:hypothetical protein
MAREDNDKSDEYGSISGLSAETLRGRQSVRATFKLPVQIIGLLSLAANQLGLKQKSLFDQLVENREILEQVAAGARRYTPQGEQRQQKTYVLSRNSLIVLDYVAKTYGVPRDLLVEISISRLVPVISSEQEKQKQRKQVLSEMETFCHQGSELLNRTEQALGAGDPTTRQLSLLLEHCKRNIEQLQEVVTRGKDIEIVTEGQPSAGHLVPGGIKIVNRTDQTN